MTALAVGVRVQLFVRGANVLELVGFGEVHALLGAKAVRKIARAIDPSCATTTINVVSPEAAIWSTDEEPPKLVLSVKLEMYDHMIHRIELEDFSTGLSELSVSRVVQHEDAYRRQRLKCTRLRPCLEQACHGHSVEWRNERSMNSARHEGLRAVRHRTST